jgi:hypothetical protein
MKDERPLDCVRQQITGVDRPRSSESGASTYDAPLPSQRRVPVPAGVLVLLAIELTFGALYMADVIASAPALPRVSLTNLDHETNIPMWFSTMQWWTLALVLASIAWSRWQRGPSLACWAFVGASALAAFLSLDEAALLHERVAQRVDAHLFDRRGTVVAHSGIWMFVVLPPMAFVAIVMAIGAWPVLRSDRRAFKIGLGGAVLFVFSAAGVEFLANFVLSIPYAYNVCVTIEELGEMFGVTLMLWSACRYARACGVSVSLAPPALT